MVLAYADILGAVQRRAAIGRPASDQPARSARPRTRVPLAGAVWPASSALATCGWRARRHGRHGRKAKASREEKQGQSEKRKVTEEPPPAQYSEPEVMGWNSANWPPTSLRQVMNLYGGTRRFLIVNVPLLFVALGANFFGSLSALLSQEALAPLVRDWRLDGVYAVRGLKRHYIDGLSCTFTYPGDWVYDPGLEISRFRREEQAYSSRGARGGSPLPLVAVKPDKGSASLALYALPAAGQSLQQALGSPTDAESIAGPVALGYLPAKKGREAVADLLVAKSLPADGARRESYRLQWRVLYKDSQAPEQSPSWDIYANLQLVNRGDKSYILLLAGSLPIGEDAAKDQVRSATDSLEALV
ncbi:unnamed protein product [Effrenium voratum]|nr:unnamed protein product [Effrenium voratum]